MPGWRSVIQILLWLPVAIGLLCFVVPRRAVPALAIDRQPRWCSAARSSWSPDFHAGQPGLQQTVNESWIPDLGVRYQLGVDGISLFLILLTALLWAGATIFSAFRVPDRRRIYFFMLGLAETATLGAFLAQDLLLFVLFFDLMLVPFWFLIGTFGGENRVAATTKMIVYTLVGSLLMLVAAIATAILAAGPDRPPELLDRRPARPHASGPAARTGSSCFFAAAFLIKMPAFLVHGWMPDAYRAAPLPVLALLSGVLSKVGAYGFLRVALPLYPQATVHFQELILVIGVASILYGSVMAFTQTNVRLIAGYSSIAQLGFITIGIFSLRADGADGSVLQMVNHGLVVAAVFLIVALLCGAGRQRGPDAARRPGDARAGARGAVPDRHAGDPGDAGVRQLHRRVLHPDRRLPGEDRLRLRGRRSGSCSRPSTRSASSSARCTTDKPDGIESREIGLRDALGAGTARRLHRRPGALPGADPGRSDAAVKDKIAATRRGPFQPAARWRRRPLPPCAPGRRSDRLRAGSTDRPEGR